MFRFQLMAGESASGQERTLIPHVENRMINVRPLKIFLASFLVLSMLAAGVVAAEESREIKVEEWTEAAKFALSKIYPYSDPIMVVDDTVPKVAIDGLRARWEVISKSELPQQDEYIIPPGPYMMIRIFDVRDGMFEFRETTGSIRKGVIGHCGKTLGIMIERGHDAKWEMVGGIQDMVC